MVRLVWGRWREEHGVSLAEMTVALIMLAAVVAIMGPVMVSSLRSGRVLGNESRAVDEIRVSVARIDRELRSACIVTSPAIDTAGSKLTFKTSIDPDAGPYEVSYEVTDGQLVRTTADGTQIIGEGLVVTADEFRYTENPVESRAQIAINLNVRYEDANSPRVIGTTIAGRNTWSGCA